MKVKELKIKVNLNSSFEIEASPNLKDWNEATDEQRNDYVKSKVRKFLVEQSYEIIDELFDGCKVEF